MKFVVFASLLVAVSAASYEQEWADFKQTYSRVYKSLREEKLRFQIFKSNLETINEHNARYENGEESYNMGVNQFTDLTDEEFQDKYLSLEKSEFNFTGTFEVPEEFTAPEAFDWRPKGAVLSVKNQGECGSCWAFSAIAAVEGQNAIKHNIKTDLSEQELLDCAGAQYGNRGCNGGLMTKAFKYITENGISTLASYSYHESVGTCAKSSHPRANVKVTGFKEVPATESALEAAVSTIGPISVAIVANKIKGYKSGVFDDPACGTVLNHGVLAVGYGAENNKQYWIVKNSWGSAWGDKGYILMSRNKRNQCGISSMTSYPILA